MAVTGRFPHTFLAADNILNGRDSRKICHNTYLKRLNSKEIAVLFHWTYIVTFNCDRSMTIDNGGWYTPTTLHRINCCLPCGYMRNAGGEWAFCHSGSGGPLKFRRGMRITTACFPGHIEGAGKWGEDLPLFHPKFASATARTAKSLKIKSLIRKYAGADKACDIKMVAGDLPPTLIKGGTNYPWKYSGCAHVQVGSNFLAHYGLIHHFIKWE